MLKLKGLLHVGIILFVLSMAFFLAGPANAENAEDAHLIKIMPEFNGNALKGFHIKSQVTNIKKDDLVIWMNGVVAHEVQIIFKEGKICRDVTANPNFKQPKFFLDARNCYTTSFLKYSTTSTLQFVELGTYNYEIISEDGQMSAKGKIIVSP